MKILERELFFLNFEEQFDSAGIVTVTREFATLEILELSMPNALLVEISNH